MREPKYIPPDPELLKIVFLVLQLNYKIADMNAELLKAVAGVANFSLGGERWERNQSS